VGLFRRATEEEEDFESTSYELEEDLMSSEAIQMSKKNCYA